MMTLIYIFKKVKTIKCITIKDIKSIILFSLEVKYFGVILDKIFIRYSHIKSKRKILNSQLNLLCIILKLKLAFHTQITIKTYLSLFNPNLGFFFNALRINSSATWYLSKSILKNNIKVESVCYKTIKNPLQITYSL